MTKTLTEQWREGTLPEGYYYTKVINILDKERIMIDYYIPELHHFEIMLSEYVKEVIVEAPSYDEYLYLKTNNDHWNKEAIRISKQAIGVVLESDELVQKIHILEKKLEIATKALKEMVGYPPTNFHDCETYMWAAQQALKEMEGVK